MLCPGVAVGGDGSEPQRDSFDNAAPAVPYIACAYAPAGLMVAKTLGNGVEYSATFDAVNRQVSCTWETGNQTLAGYNYAYDWVTINLDRDDRDLLMRMELSGRPARLLPFGLSRQGGLFKAEPDSAWRANFQGINFLFNFRLPLEQMLEYGKDMNGIMENAMEDAAEDVK